MRGPIMIAYPNEINLSNDNDNENNSSSSITSGKNAFTTTNFLQKLSKDYNLNLIGIKWKNTFLNANQVSDLKSEGTYRGEVLGLFMRYQRSLLRGFKVYLEKQTTASESESEAITSNASAAGNQEMKEGAGKLNT